MPQRAPELAAQRAAAAVEPYGSGGSEILRSESDDSDKRHGRGIADSARSARADIGGGGVGERPGPGTRTQGPFCELRLRRTPMGDGPRELPSLDAQG